MVNFESGIKNVLQQVHPGMEISMGAVKKINTILNKLGRQLSVKYYEVGSPTKAVYDVFPKYGDEPVDIAKHAVLEGKRFTKSKLVSSTGKIKEIFGHIDQHDLVYFTLVLKYITAEVLEPAGNLARDRKYGTKRLKTFLDPMVIKPGDIEAVIREDEELKALVKKLNRKGSTKKSKRKRRKSRKKSRKRKRKSKRKRRRKSRKRKRKSKRKSRKRRRKSKRKSRKRRRKSACKSGKIRSPTSGRCIKKGGAAWKKAFGSPKSKRRSKRRKSA